MNDSQEKLLKLALYGDEANIPFITNDPEVNHAVDIHMEDRTFPYDKELYEKEIEAWKSEGKLLLGWV